MTSVDDLLDPQTGLLLEAGEEDDKPIGAVSKAVSAAFRADDPPAFVVVQAGQWLLLAEAERWAEGRYLAVDLLVVAERRDDKRGGEIDRVAAMLEQAGAAARRRRKHLVDRDSRGLGQAHRRGVEGSA